LNDYSSQGSGNKEGSDPRESGGRFSGNGRPTVRRLRRGVRHRSPTGTTKAPDQHSCEMEACRNELIYALFILR
jgi:hypothetical protein